MKKNYEKTILIVLLILILCGFFIFALINNSVKTIEFNSIDKFLAKVDYSIVYFGEITDEIEEMVDEATDETRIKFYKSNATLDELKTKTGNQDLESTDVFLLFLNSDFEMVISKKDLTNTRFKELVRKAFFNEIPESEREYKVVRADDFIKKVNSKNYTISVFGFAGCTHCNLYMPAINEIAAEYKLDIYYFDRDNYDEKEYLKVMNLDLEIPAKCTLDGKDTSTLYQFPKPMTLITKNGKTVDCIRGNVKKEEVVEKLKSLKIIKEKK